MSQYKLIYFDGRGRAEIIRLVFAAAGVPFEDVRVSREKWSEMKPSAPLQQLPLLEADGITLFQSLAIARYLARKYGLAGKTEQEQLRADILVDSIEDINKPTALFLFMEKDEEKKAALRKTFIEETLPNFLRNFEKLLTSNATGDDYLVGDSLTWADLYFLAFLGRLDLQIKVENPLKDFAKLKALSDRVSKHPKIAEYIAKRPHTPF